MYEYFYKFEIKYCGKIVLTDPFNYTVVVVHDLHVPRPPRRIPFLGGLGCPPACSHAAHPTAWRTWRPAWREAIHDGRTD